MKKKIITALTALMVLSMGTTVFAATSPTPSTPVDEYAATVGSITIVGSANGNLVAGGTVAVVPVENAQAVAIETLANNNATETTKDEVLTVVEVPFAPGITNMLGAVTLTFEIDGVKAGDNITAWHYGANGWEKDSCKVTKVEDGKVTATFSELSPVAFVKTTTVAAEKSAEQEAWETWWWLWVKSNMNPTTTAVDAPATTSPKTFDATLGLMAMAALCGAGATVCAKKSK